MVFHGMIMFSVDAESPVCDASLIYVPVCASAFSIIIGLLFFINAFCFTLYPYFRARRINF
jgi:hypothetical protein